MFDQLAPLRDASSLKPVAMSDLDTADPGPSSLPERPFSQLLAAMLNEIDYGMLLISRHRLVLHANHAARAELDSQHPLQLDERELRARDPRDAAPLQEAVAGACRYGRRRLLTLRGGSQLVTTAVVPLLAGEGIVPAEALVVLGKRQVCQALSVEAFARCHKLTLTETTVLKALCIGTRPTQIARQHGVALSTVRTQLSSIRAKTGAETISSLVRMVAMLPPMVGVLRQVVTASFDPRHRNVASAQWLACPTNGQQAVR